MKTKVIEIHPEYFDLKDIVYCAKVIREGGLVIFPTETVYGVAADFNNEQAMKRLREVKQRAEDKPFTVLISQKNLITNYTSMTDPKLFKLMDAFWPGPVTLVVPHKSEEKTIGVRMPDNLIALKLAQESQCTLAAPSANIEGNDPPTTCQGALKDLDGKVEVAINGGTAEIGKGSTVVDITEDEPKVLREGVVTLEDINRVSKKKKVLFVCTGNSCRSVMAEYMLKSMLAARDDVTVESAGTGVFLQATASSETISVLANEGIDANEHMSRPVSSLLLKSSDLIFVMTRTHRQQILERAPEVEKRVYLLKEFINSPAGLQTELDIPDPIGRSHDAYKECLAVIKEAIHKIVELV